jgi:glycosyltransferase involved in cell wall biosynthesis
MLQRLREWNRARVDARRGRAPACTDAEYAQWVRKHDTVTESARVGLLQRARRIAHGPRISIVMPVFDPNPAWLNEAIDSVRAQLYVNWELCIADDASTDPRIRDILAQAATLDARIRVHWRARNGHICAASNAALAMATGPYVALLDHDDVLPEHALLCVAEAILRTPDVDVLYSDEDKIDGRGRRHDPYFKRDWNAELLRGHNFISHLGVYRTDLVREVGGFRAGFEGSQDYDLALRCTERSALARIVHIPHALYHWRAHAQSTASDVGAKPYALDAGVRALQEHLNRLHARGDAFLRDGSYQVLYQLPSPWPSVAVVLLDIDGRWTLRRALRRIAGAPNIHVLSSRSRAHGWDHIGWHRAHGGVTPRACNSLIASLRVDVIVLLDSDCVPATWNALLPLVAHAMQPGVAAAGPRVVAGKCIVGTAMVGSDGGLVPWADGWRARSGGYFGYAAHAQDVAALGRGCVVFQRRLFENTRGFTSGGNDFDIAIVDATLRMATGARRNRWVPSVTCTRPRNTKPPSTDAFDLGNPNLRWQHHRLVYADPPRVTWLSMPRTADRS